MGQLEFEPNPSKAIYKEVESDFGVSFEGNFFTAAYDDLEEPTVKMFYQGTINKEPIIKSVKTIAEIKWFDFDEIESVNIAFNDKDIIREFIANTGKPSPKC